MIQFITFRARPPMCRTRGGIASSRKHASTTTLGEKGTQPESKSPRNDQLMARQSLACAALCAAAVATAGVSTASPSLRSLLSNGGGLRGVASPGPLSWSAPGHEVRVAAGGHAFFLAVGFASQDSQLQSPIVLTFPAVLTPPCRLLTTSPLLLRCN